MIVDAHLHVWDLAQANYPWLTPEIGALYRSVGFDEIAPTLSDRGIGGAVLVQASDETADTDLMLAVAAQHEQVLGVVAWTPLDDPAQVERDLQRFSAFPEVVGIRNLFHERSREWARSQLVGDGLAMLAARGIPLDFPTADHTALGEIAWIGEQHPSLTIVIDHLGKPPVGGSAGEHADWHLLIAECAANPNTVAKVSGLYASRGPLNSWTVEAVRPFVDEAMRLFGPDRLLYGGDWPISELAGGYARTWDAMTRILADVGERDRDLILGGTATRVYGLDQR
jgi:L-fuconolactonase